MRGYLVVERNLSPKFPRNSAYRGLDRMPPYYDGTPKDSAMDDYVFGDYKNEAGLISTYDRAGELRRRLADEGSDCEVIYAITIGDARESTAVTTRLLGYDVVAESPFYSIVADWCPDDLLASRELNVNGLFDDGKQAKDWVIEYRRQYPEDAAIPYWIAKVWLAEAEG